MYIALGISQTVALFGFVLTFIAKGNLWYVAGLAVTLALLAVNAPTRAAIERTQRQLDAAGCQYQLGPALARARRTD